MSNSFSLVTGRVTRILLIDPDGNNISLSKVTEWDWKEDNKDVPSTGLDGVREILIAFNGASGSFACELQDNGLDNFFNARKLEYQTTGGYRYSTLYGYIDMPNGTTMTLTFKNCSLVRESMMNKNEETTKFKVTFQAQDVLLS